jgi:metal-responsive CopG/Arc/MetJ family transcriptional regulator
MALVRTNVHLDEKELAEIDKLVKPYNLSRAWFIRQAVTNEITRTRAKGVQISPRTVAKPKR